MEKTRKDTLDVIQAVEDALSLEGMLREEDKSALDELKTHVTTDKTKEELESIGAKAMKYGDERVLSVSNQ